MKIDDFNKTVAQSVHCSLLLRINQLLQIYQNIANRYETLIWIDFNSDMIIYDFEKVVFNKPNWYFGLNQLSKNTWNVKKQILKTSDNNNKYKETIKFVVSNSNIELNGTFMQIWYGWKLIWQDLARLESQPKRP